MLGNVILDRRDQDLDAGKSPANAFVRDIAEPTLHQIQPRTARRDKVDVEAGVAAQPLLDGGMLMGGIVVDDEVQVQVWGGLPIHLSEELEPLLVAVSRRAGGDEPAVGQVEGCEEGCGAIALVVMGHGPAASSLQREAGLCSVQGLDLTLLIQTEHQGMVGRIEI